MSIKKSKCQNCGSEDYSLVNSKLVPLEGTDNKSWYKKCLKCKKIRRI
jgi:hypothetical protein